MTLSGLRMVSSLYSRGALRNPLARPIQKFIGDLNPVSTMRDTFLPVSRPIPSAVSTSRLFFFALPPWELLVPRGDGDLPGEIGPLDACSVDPPSTDGSLELDASDCNGGLRSADGWADQVLALSEGSVS